MRGLPLTINFFQVILPRKIPEENTTGVSLMYVMDSEPEIDHKYADLTMMIRPDKRHFKIFDVLIEFKFVTLKDAGITGEEAKQLPENDLYGMPKIKKALEEGGRQVALYAKNLDEKYGNLRLMVAALVFERVCFKKID